MNEPHSELDAVGRVAEAFLARYRRGERPSVTEYTAKYPELAEQIRDLFPTLVVMEELGSVAGPRAGSLTGTVPGKGKVPEQLGDYRILREVGRGGMGVVYEAVQESLGRHVALKVFSFHGLLPPTYLERFRREARAAARLHHPNIVPVFGVGEHEGVHYYAMQFIQGQGLDEVLKAVKRLRRPKDPSSAENAEPGADRSQSLAQGLLSGHFAEPGALVVRRTDFQSVRPSDGLGIRPTEEGSPAASPPPAGSAEASLTSAGSASRTELTAQPEAQYFRSVARMAGQVAAGLDYAHKQGVLHRDIKPSNLLLDAHGTVWITDFGLAKHAASPGGEPNHAVSPGREPGDEDLTHTGDIVGTLRYMAPERLHGWSDPRSDVYGLGITLYELLTLRPAFEDSSRPRLIERVTHEDPPRPRKVDRSIPRDLETIVLKAIDKEPGRRYQTAAELGEDLGRFQAGEPVRARRIGMWERGAKWAKRRPAVAALLGVIGLALASLLAGGAKYYADLQAAYHETTQERNAARAAEDQARQQRDAANDAERKARDETEATRKAEAKAQQERAAALQALERARRSVYALQLAQVANVWERDPGYGLELLKNRERCPPDLRDFTWGYYYRLCKRDRLTLTFSNTDDKHSPVATTPDGKMLAVGGYSQEARLGGKWGGEVKLWDLGTGKELHTFPVHFDEYDEVLSVAFTEDGSTLAVGCMKGTLKLWDVATRKEKTTLQAPLRSPIQSLALTPDGKTVAAGLRGSAIRVWDVASGKELASLHGHAPYFASFVAFLAEGKVLASSGADATVRLWDLAAGKEKAIWKGIRGQALTRDGRLLAGTGNDNRLRLWDVATGTELAALPGPPALISTLAFTPDDKFLASAGGDRMITLWDVAARQQRAVLRGHNSMVTFVSFTAEGRALISGSKDGEVRVWHPFTKPYPALLGKNPVTSLTFAPDGKTLATPGPGGAVTLWDGVTRKARRFLQGDRQNCHALAVSPDGKTLAAGGNDKQVALWDLATGRELRILRGDGLHPCAALAFSPDGKTLATDYKDGLGTVKLWDPATGKELATLKGHRTRLAALVFSPDGKTLASAGGGKEDEDQTVEVILWEVATLQERLRLPGHKSSATPVAFSPDGRTLAWGTEEGAKLWDLAAGHQRKALQGYQDSTHCVAFSPDGKTLATGYQDGTAKLWDTVDGLERATLKVSIYPVLSLTFSPDGKTLATGAQGGVVRLWEAVPWTAPGATRPAEEKRLPAADTPVPEMADLWADLAGTDAARAYRALWAMADAPAQAVPFLRARLRPVVALTPDQQQQVDQWLRDLDHDRFAVREKASEELERLAEATLPSLRQTLAGRPSAEVRRRVERLLQKLADSPLSPEQLRALRAVEVLEYVGTSEARRLLEVLAAGLPEARLTQEAKASVERLAGRSALTGLP